MGYALNHTGLGAFAGRPASEDAAKPRSSVKFLLARFFRAFMNARQRQADREISRYFDRSSNILTDSGEREMMQRLVSGGWSTRR
jgi:hypothetical protein